MRHSRSEAVLGEAIQLLRAATAPLLPRVVENSVRWRMTKIQGDAAVTILSYTTDEKARITLPQSFANSTVLVEQVSETELRIRKARVTPEDDLPFVEEALTPLSDRDRDAFLALLDNPPPPNDALRRLLTSGRDRQNQGD